MSAGRRAHHGARVPHREKYGKTASGALTRVVFGPRMVRPLTGECQHPAGK